MIIYSEISRHMIRVWQQSRCVMKSVIRVNPVVPFNVIRGRPDNVLSGSLLSLLNPFAPLVNICLSAPCTRH